MTTSPESLALLGRAAELRAAGTPWADTATRLAVDPQELRRLAAEHHRDYERLTRRARTELLRETLDAALTALRAQIHSPDPHLSYLAATTFVRYELACMRHGTREARERLERDTSPRGRRRLTAEAENVRATNASESPEVPNRQGVGAPKNASQSAARSAPPTPPASASPAPPAAAKATPPAAPTTPPQGKPTPPVAAQGQVPPEELARRRRVLLNDFALPGAARPLGKDDRLDQEVARLVGGWLADGK